MPIPIISEIVPQNDGNFPTHLSQYGKGGWHEVADVDQRELIPRERRSAGMAVHVVDINRSFILGPDLSSWEEFVTTGIPDAPLDGQSYVRNSGEWLAMTDFLDGGIYAP